ncbi:MAG: hypothetical protein K2J54_05090 [Clostridia bacterium]|nr:hypothetical protein [Clostridia bacterium]
MAKGIKVLCVKRFGWKRIAKNTQRFGWVLSDAEEETTVTETTTYEGKVVGDTLYVNPRTNRSSKVRVWLSFYRNMYIPAGVRILEFFYNVFFLLRRILAFFLPLIAVGSLILMLTGGVDILLSLMLWIELAFGLWIAFIILEGILARIAYAVLAK